MNIATAIHTLTWLHAAFGIGGAGVTLFLARYTSFMAFLGSPTGQRDEKDVLTILSAAADALNTVPHTQATSTASALNTIVSDLQKVAPLKVTGLLIGFLALGAMAHADVTPTASSVTTPVPVMDFRLVPRLTGSASLYTFGDAGSIVPGNGSEAGADESLTWGQEVTDPTNGKPAFQGLVDIGLHVGTYRNGATTQADFGLGLDYEAVGIQIVEPVGNGLSAPIIGVRVGLALFDLLPWDWSIKL